MSFFKLMWKANSKHKKLSEELVLKNNGEIKESENSLSNENDAITFKLKYLDSTAVETITGANVSAETVKKIVKHTKELKRKTLPTVYLKVSLKGITVTDLLGNDIQKISIYSISNCSIDVSHRHIFSFISSDSNRINTCHVFLCGKRKIAQNVTLAVASAFSSAYQAWNHLSLPDQPIDVLKTNENEKNNLNQMVNSENEEKLIDLESDLFDVSNRSFANKTNRDWVSFDDDYFNNCDFQ